MTGFKSYLFISPHADDSEFGCGALMASLARQPEVAVHLLVLTTREKTTGESREQMTAYQLAALDELGLSGAKLHIANLLPRRLPDLHEEIRQILDAHRRAIGPDIVFTTPENDRMQDHHAVALEVDRIFRGVSVLEYEVLSSSLKFIPNVFIETSETDLECKIRALQCHQGQAHKHYFTDESIRSLARLRGLQSTRYRYAEGFRVRNLVFEAMK
ncbi:MAG: hypothetical protein HN348_29440 [Proteobacteria bacterium]|jgi:N-acetylglucosamine malate deacetylase 1|nr:hypothetical protein [Pseudomonadota bacterium]